MHFRIIFVLVFSLVIKAGAQNRGDLLIGKWMDSKHQTLVQCYKDHGKYFAKVLWVENLKNKGKPLPAHEQHWINMVVMKNFEYRINEWVNGTIYQPRTNKTYSAYLTLTNDNTLRLTGYIWLRMFSETEIFTRVKNK